MADPMTLPEIEEKEAEWAQLGVELEDDLQKLKADPATPQAMTQRCEKAIGALHRAYVGLRRPDEATAHEARDVHAAAGKSPGLRDALSKAEQLQEFDPALSSAEAFREAARDPEVQKAYLAENGITAPVRPKPAGLAKGETGPAQADVDAVGRRADLLEKSENLSPTVAYRQAVRELAAA